jgi:BMFP domain-containing protein YqiC
MAKKDKKGSKKDRGRDPSEVVDAVRGAVERTFQATAGGTDAARDRGRSLLDDVASAAQRIRESFDDLRVLEDVRGVRAELDALRSRVEELEKQVAAAKPAPARKTTARAGRATGTARKAPAKPSAAATAAKTTAAKPKPAPGQGAASSRRRTTTASSSSGGTTGRRSTSASSSSGGTTGRRSTSASTSRRRSTGTG